MTPALCGTCSAPSSPSGWCSPTPPTASVSSSPNQTTPNRLTPETLQLIGRAAAQDPALLVVLALVGVPRARASTGSERSPWSTWICPTPASISAAPPGQWTRSPRTRSASTSPTGTIVGRAGNPAPVGDPTHPFSWAPSFTRLAKQRVEAGGPVGSRILTVISASSSAQSADHRGGPCPGLFRAAR
jgi:hypothetical protein